MVRDVRVPPGTRVAPDPLIVDFAADQYRSAVLEAPGTSPQEYLVWTAFSSQLAMIEDPDWWTGDGSGRIPVGSITVPASPTAVSDGTLKVIVTDDGGRQIGLVTHLVIARGGVEHNDTGWVDTADPSKGRTGSLPYYVVVPAAGDQAGGVVTLKDSNVFMATGAALVPSTVMALFGGGLSLKRGDAVISVRHTLAAVKFWWTRNDRYETRFGWNGKLQRWMPYKGSGPINLGPLLFDEQYKLSPPLSNLPVGAVLPGNALVGDEYAMLRLGTTAGRFSTPVGINDGSFTGVIVVSDGDVEGQYDFSGQTHSAVVGQTSGTLQFNPLFIEANAGKTIWYVYRGFDADSDGYIGDIDDDELFIAPLPSATDHPFIRINNRTPLAVELVPTELDLDITFPTEGSCAVALTTGKLKLAQADLDKANPANLASFNKHYLGARIIYDGVALNAIPQPTKGPRPLVQGDGVTETLHPNELMYLPPAIVWPEDHAVGDEAYRGLGMSGVLYMPDGTGAIPDPEGVTPAAVPVPVRPGGDTLAGPPQTLGLIRQIHDGVGDTILFSKNGAITDVVVVPRNSDLPSLWDIEGPLAYIARESTTVGGEPMSAVQVNLGSRGLFGEEKVYFLQASLNPSVYTEQASIASKSRIVFRFDGTEKLYFAIDGTDHEWSSSTLLAALPDNEFFDAGEVAASIQAKITADGGTGICRAAGDRVVLEESDPDSGYVEIGWGSSKDLSGAAALGFLPGWRAEAGKPNWLTDSGISMGLSRSLLNLDRSQPTADYLAQYRLEDQVLASSVQASPFVFLDRPPVEDIAGFDEGVFFNLQSVALQGDDLRIIDKRLGHFAEIEHRFSEGKVAWLDESISSNPVLQRTAVINLGNPAIVPETLLGAPGIGGGFMAAVGAGPYAIQEQGVDYLFTDDGQSGATQLITRYGARTTFGGQGHYGQGQTAFIDPNANFLADSNDPDNDPITGLQKVDPATGDLLWLPVLRPGVRLKLASGPAAGSYIVQSVTNATNCVVQPPFPATMDRPTPWEAFAGYPDSVYDPAIIADQIYKPFTHLAEEPFKIRVLTPLGVPLAATADFTAHVEDANASGRPISLRFGPVHSAAGVVASLTPLTLTSLGIIANNQLVLPTTTHVSEGAFIIRVGTEELAPTAVASFSADPAEVEYLTAAWDDGTMVHPVGELKFNSTLLVQLESSGVYLVETLRASGALPSGEAEYDPKTGQVRISAVDLATHADKQLYFTEQMITGQADADVVVSPLVGAVSFLKPVATGCLVEMEYWQADVEGRRVGDPIVEFLPVFVRRELPTRITDHEFNLDALGEHVIDTRIAPIVYVGPKQQNFGETDFTVDTPAHLDGMRLTFNRDLPAWANPVVSYAVFDALGGERAYETSTKPVYRPPFFIKAGKDNFGLRGNRVADFEVGQMLRIGAECFYITKLKHFPDPDTTRVDIFPSTAVEVGSRSPGNDVLTLVTAGPITPVLDPDGISPIMTTAPTGFMQQPDLSYFTFEPVNAKQNTMTFLGDISAFAVPGHIMEVAGMPFTIAQAVLSEDGTRTKLTFTAPFRRAVTPATSPTVRLSYRPVYPPESRQFMGVGPYVASEGIELTLFGEVVNGVEQPGRRLASGTEYSIDPETGALALLSPLQEPLGPKQKLLLSFTRIRVMEPFLSGGSVQFPRWYAKYKHNVLPSDDNGYLGGTLTATYTFDNPDTFYFRVLPLRSYLAEAVTQAVKEMKQGQAAGGPILSVAAGTNNWEQGNQGLVSQRRDLSDKDRAARSLLTFYNNTVVAFEQVDEAITGKFIGDRDGKFRFWIGRGAEFAPPGFEDQITGELNASNVWATVFNEADPTRGLTFLVDGDPLVRPTLCSIVNLQLAGQPLGASELGKLMGRQRALVRNDVDDILLLAASTPKTIKTSAPPYFTIESGGVFARMGSAHRFSRLYPTKARVLFTLQPGIGADLASGDVGTYSWRSLNPETGEIETTNGEQIGQVANPVLGDITDVSSSVIRMRLPRTRIVSYHPNGLPASAFGIGIPRPCCIVSAVPLADLPIDPATGFPDPAQLLSIGPGEVSDAAAGDPDYALPGFTSGQKIGWGKPDGRFLAAKFLEDYDLFGTKILTSVFIDDVAFGCVLTFADRQGNPILDPNKLLVGSTDDTGVPAHQFGIERADTIYVLPPDAGNPISDPAADSPTMEAIQQMALLTPAFVQGKDINVGTDGRIIDLSLPSWADPFIFPIKEMSGQKTPLPMSHLEGSVDFVNLRQLPLQVPALLGKPEDDSGDFQIPYMKGTNTELDRFDEITNVIGPLMAEVPGGPGSGGVYPDEIVSASCEVLGAPAVALGGGFFREPATLMMPAKTDPAPSFGTAPAREGDFVLVEAVPGSPEGWQGFLSVGRLRNNVAGVPAVNWSWIEPPRFVTQVSQGSDIRYDLDNYAVWLTGGPYLPDPQVGNPVGVRLFDDIANGNTIISFNDVAFTLNDGSVGGAGVGNLNTIIAADPGNIVRIDLISRTDDTAVNAPAPAGAGGFTPVEKDGQVFFFIEIRQAFARVSDWQGNTSGWVPHAGVQFGVTDVLNPGGEILPGVGAAFDPDRRHVIITGWSGVIPFTPAGGTELEWFLPHQHLDPAGPTDRKISMYGWEFAISIDTSDVAFPASKSTSAYIDSDRLTFHEVVDFTFSRPRGYAHELNPANTYETSLRVKEVLLGTLTMSNCNDVIGAPLTFDSRLGSTTGIEGTWNAAPSPAEEGSIRVMSFEFTNTAIAATGITASVVASQTTDPSGTDILTGDGFARNNHISLITVATGDIEKVQKGDVVYVDRSAAALPDSATEKAGTYLVRYAVKPEAGKAYKKVTKTAVLGTGLGFITTPFPRVTLLDVLGQQITVDDASMLPATGRLFIAIRPTDLADANPAVFQKALFSVEYTGVAGNVITLGAAAVWRWADDGAIGANLAAIAVEITPALVVGKQMGWHDNSAANLGVTALGVDVRGGDLPDDSSVVGYHLFPGVAGVDNATYGIHGLTYTSSHGAVTLAQPVINTVAIPTVAGEARVTAATPHANETFDPTNSVPVYSNVPEVIHLHLSAAQGITLNNPNGHPAGNGVACLLPSTEVSTEDGGDAFYAAGGVYVEPSLPWFPVQFNGTPKVVDRTRSLGPGTVGMRNVGVGENVHFEVRRVRRWHGAQSAINDAFQPLRYAYEIRRGRITDYSRNPQQVGLVTALDFQMNWNVGTPFPRVPEVWSDNDGKLHTGTNLGPFDSEDVNIHPGDFFRLLNDEGVVLEEAIISEVVSPSQLKLKAPGFATLTEAEVKAGDRRFEIWLRQAPVPHEQSNEQLLDLITDRVVHETVADQSDADPQNWVGGYVPEVVAAGAWSDISNKLYDDSATPPNFIALGVRKGDIVVIDPMGMLPVVDERGFRPLGDRSVPTRTSAGVGPPPSPYVAGAVSSLDDNRGFYRVESVEATNLTLNPAHLFAGSHGSDVVMGGARTTIQYAIYPTVGVSPLNADAIVPPATAEGQNDLRPTRKAVGGTFKDPNDSVADKHSMRPFSYRIIRPSGMFSTEIVDTVLTIRERMLSLIEMFRGAIKGEKGGFYWDWQDLEHVEDLGDSLDPDSGLGLFPNRLVTTLVGEMSHSPFINTSDCLSLLDRRFWVLDRKLDSLEPDPTNDFAMRALAGAEVYPEVDGPYTAYTSTATGGAEVRPVLPDYLGQILDSRDRLRAIRYTWLAYRTHRLIGTLVRMAAFDAELPLKLEQRKRTLLLEQTAEGVET